MIVRYATVEDISAMVALGRKGHALSDHAHIEFDADLAGALGMRAIMASDACALVAYHDGEVCGLLIGAIEPWPFLKWKIASDIVTYATRPGAGKEMLKAFEDWAWKRGADEMILGVTFGGKDATAVYERRGFKRLGGMFAKQKEAYQCPELSKKSAI